MLTAYFKDPPTVVRYRQGPAGPELEEFVGWLAKRGYRRGSIRRSVRAAHRFGLWAESAGLTLPQLDRTALAAFGEHLRRHHRLERSKGDFQHAVAGAHNFVDFLADTDRLAHPAPALSAPSEPALLTAFRGWMSAQRGTLDATLNNYRLTLLDLLETVGDLPSYRGSA